MLPILLVSMSLSLLPAAFSLVCQQCGGELYGGGLRLSRDECCQATPVTCTADQVCIRALVSSPSKRFFLSGCHVPEDGLIGCDSHSLPLNATVHRCICLDVNCQSYFPGHCPSHLPTVAASARRTPRPPLPTTRSAPSSHRPPPPGVVPSTVARIDLNRADVKEAMGIVSRTSPYCFVSPNLFSLTLVVSLYLYAL